MGLIRLLFSLECYKQTGQALIVKNTKTSICIPVTMVTDIDDNYYDNFGYKDTRDLGYVDEQSIVFIKKEYGDSEFEFLVQLDGLDNNVEYDIPDLEIYSDDDEEFVNLVLTLTRT